MRLLAYIVRILTWPTTTPGSLSTKPQHLALSPSAWRTFCPWCRPHRLRRPLPRRTTLRQPPVPCRRRSWTPCTTACLRAAGKTATRLRSHPWPSSPRTWRTATFRVADRSTRASGKDVCAVDTLVHFPSDTSSSRTFVRTRTSVHSRATFADERLRARTRETLTSRSTAKTAWVRGVADVRVDAFGNRGAVCVVTRRPVLATASCSLPLDNRSRLTIAGAVVPRNLTMTTRMIRPCRQRWLLWTREANEGTMSHCRLLARLCG